MKKIIIKALAYLSAYFPSVFMLTPKTHMHQETVGLLEQ